EGPIGQKFRWRPGSIYHPDGTAIDRDLGTAPDYKNGWILLSRRFRYFGRNGPPTHNDGPLRELLDRLTQGFRANLDSTVYRALTELQKWAFSVEGEKEAKAHTPVPDFPNQCTCEWEGEIGTND